MPYASVSSSTLDLMVLVAFLQLLLMGWGMHTLNLACSLHCILWGGPCSPRLPHRINSKGHRFASTFKAGRMHVCKDAALRRAQRNKPNSRTTLLWEPPLSWAHLIKGDLLVIPVLDVEEHHHPPVLVPAGQDAGVAGLDGAAHGLGAQVVKELGVLLAEVHIAWREAEIGKTGCSPSFGKLGELPEMGWSGDGEKLSSRSAPACLVLSVPLPGASHTCFLSNTSTSR